MRQTTYICDQTKKTINGSIIVPCLFFNETEEQKEMSEYDQKRQEAIQDLSFCSLNAMADYIKENFSEL